MAKKIVSAQTRNGDRGSRKAMSAEKLGVRLDAVLERYQERWNPKELAELVRQLRNFADALDEQKGGKKTKKESPTVAYSPPLTGALNLFLESGISIHSGARTGWPSRTCHISFSA